MKLSRIDYFAERGISEEDILEFKVDYDWVKSGQYIAMVKYGEPPNQLFIYSFNDKGVYLFSGVGDDSFLTND